MGETIFLRTSGHKNSSFFDLKLSVASLKSLILVIGAAVALSIGLLTAYAALNLRPVDALLTRLEHVSAAAQDIAEQSWQVKAYLTAGSDYAAAEHAALAIQAAVERLAPLIDDYNALNQLEAASAAYINLLRSYHNVAGAADTGDTLTLLRAELDATGNSLDQVVNSIRMSSLAAARTITAPLPDQIVRLAFAVLLVLGAIFALGLLLLESVTQHSARFLRDLREITFQITDGHFDARVNLKDEVDPDLIQLGLAVNRMADNLKAAQQSEFAATEQNRLQLLKLARQERMNAILEERQRIARELHDSVKQQLFSITLSAGAVLNLLTDAPALVKTHLEHIKQTSYSAQSEMTNLLQELVSMPLQDKRLEDALLDHLNPLCATHGLKLLWRTDGTNTLTIAQEHALFRAVQEAVANVVRHSSATVLRVSLRYGLVTYVIVEDNGTGFASDDIASTSNGLAMMRTRLKRVGGRFEIESTPGAGTRLTIQLDLRRR